MPVLIVVQRSLMCDIMVILTGVKETALDIYSCTLAFGLSWFDCLMDCEGIV